MKAKFFNEANRIELFNFSDNNKLNATVIELNSFLRQCARQYTILQKDGRINIYTLVGDYKLVAQRLKLELQYKYGKEYIK